MIESSVRQRAYRIPYELPIPPPIFQSTVSRVVDLITITGHYAPLARFNSISQRLSRRDASGKSREVKPYHARSPGVHGNASE